MFWNCGAVDRLCYSMDDILSHGLKEGYVLDMKISLSWAHTRGSELSSD